MDFTEQEKINGNGNHKNNGQNGEKLFSIFPPPVPQETGVDFVTSLTFLKDQKEAETRVKNRAEREFLKDHGEAMKALEVEDEDIETDYQQIVEDIKKHKEELARTDPFIKKHENYK